MWDLEGISENYEIMNAALDVKSIGPSKSCAICLEIRAMICFVLQCGLIRNFIYLKWYFFIMLERNG